MKTYNKSFYFCAILCWHPAKGTDVNKILSNQDTKIKIMNTIATECSLHRNDWGYDE
jgi:hypothetical protein